MQIRFDDITVPAAKLDAVVSENMQKVRKVYKEKKRRKLMIKCAAAAVAVVAAAAGVCFTHPVLAAKIPLIGHIFELVQDEQLYPGNFDEVAQLVTDNNSCTSEGITITLSEIYSNTEALYVSVMIESEEAFSEEVLNSGNPGGDGTGYWMFLDVEEEFDFMEVPGEYESWEWPGEDFKWNPLDIRGGFVDEHTFAGAFRIDYGLYPLIMSEVPDAFNWKLKVRSIDRYDLYHKEGMWTFDIDVTLDQEAETRVIEVDESAPNGSVIKTITVTDYEVRIDFEFDESRVQPGYEEFDSVQSVMLDADGKRIRDKVGMFPTENYNISEITVYYFPTPTEADFMAVQEKIVDESFADELPGYLEEIAMQKTIINLE